MNTLHVQNPFHDLIRRGLKKVEIRPGRMSEYEGWKDFDVGCT
jgi:hypothetical protein